MGSTLLRVSPQNNFSIVTPPHSYHSYPLGSAYGLERAFRWCHKGMRTPHVSISPPFQRQQHIPLPLVEILVVAWLATTGGGTIYSARGKERDYSEKILKCYFGFPCFPGFPYLAKWFELPMIFMFFEFRNCHTGTWQWKRVNQQWMCRRFKPRDPIPTTWSTCWYQWQILIIFSRQYVWCKLVTYQVCVRMCTWTQLYNMYTEVHVYKYIYIYKYIFMSNIIRFCLPIPWPILRPTLGGGSTRWQWCIHLEMRQRFLHTRSRWIWFKLSPSELSGSYTSQVENDLTENTQLFKSNRNTFGWGWNKVCLA